jgi:hypothetical protein
MRIAGFSVVLLLPLAAAAAPAEKGAASSQAARNPFEPKIFKDRAPVEKRSAFSQAARYEPTAESTTAWQWFHEVAPPKEDKSPWIDFLLTNEVFGEARTDLADLRLWDAGGREVPYALRVRRTRQEQQSLESRQFNGGRQDDLSFELSLDLDRQSVEHNLIEIVTKGDDFRRRVRVEGSDDGRDWRLLAEDWLVHFPVRDRPSIDSNRVTYPPCRYRYLRVQVRPDRSLPHDSPDISSVSVFHTVNIPGEYRTLPAVLGLREPDKTPYGPGSAWSIDLGADSVPCEMLRLEIDDDGFTRHYDLESTEPGGVTRIVAQGEIRRLPGSSHEPMEIRFAETTTHFLKLRVTDHRNPPLDLKGVQYTAPARELVFARRDVALPLRLYVGNPRAAEPHYDFAAGLAEVLRPAPDRVAIGPPTANPTYRPEPKPWTDRWPWAIYVVLGSASLVLLALLGLLAREAISRQGAADRQKTQP